MTTQLRTACISVFLLLTLSSTSAFAAGPRYTVTDLGTLDGPSAARAINNAGVVVGTFEDSSIGFERAFVWRNGVMTRLEDLNVDGAAFAMAIGDGGHIAGFASPVPGGGPMHAVRWINRQIQDLGESFGNGVDHRGRVVGVDGNGRATLWDQAGTPVNLIPQQTDSLNEARAINARGQVVGGGLRPNVVRKRACLCLAQRRRYRSRGIAERLRRLRIQRRARDQYRRANCRRFADGQFPRQRPRGDVAERTHHRLGATSQFHDQPGSRHQRRRPGGRCGRAFLRRVGRFSRVSLGTRTGYGRSQHLVPASVRMGVDVRLQVSMTAGKSSASACTMASLAASC